MAELVETKDGVRISVLANIRGAASISISDYCTLRARCTLNGQENYFGKPLIVLGKNVTLMEHCLIEPPNNIGSGDTPLQMVVGNFSTIGKRTVVRLSLIGNRVHVGSNCYLGEHTVINDCCIIESNVTIPARSVIPPYSKVRQSHTSTVEIEQLSAAYRRVLEVNSHFLTYIK